MTPDVTRNFPAIYGRFTGPCIVPAVRAIRRTSVLLDSRQDASIRLFGGRGFVRQDGGGGGVAVVDPPNRMEGS